MERARKSSRNVPNDDRLSALPDGIIRHILSFLETQYSVQTSILAKRWRFMWAHVPVLDFDWKNVSSKSSRFPGIVNTVMLRHKVQSLNTFRLTYYGGGGGDDDDDDDGEDYPCYELETCIVTVVERNVQNLFLALRVEVPRCLLTCKSLVVLTIRNGVRIPPSAPISLPSLKKLYLHHFECQVDFTRLISGCPRLEELSILTPKCRDPRGCSISSPTLKRLTTNHLLGSDMFDNPDYMVTINTPALTYLKVFESSSKYISISPCNSIVEADISFDYYHREPDVLDYRCVLDLLDSIRNVKCLNLSVHCGKIWEGPMPGTIAKFDNLTKLRLRANWFFLTKLLESADHLQVLTISEDEWSFSNSKQWAEPVEERRACLSHSLRTVRIDRFGCREQSFNMVRYILRNARVMERMEIYCPRLDVETKFDAIREISIFPRGSEKCELHFS